MNWKMTLEAMKDAFNKEKLAAEDIERWRLARGFSQEKLAEILGKSQSTAHRACKSGIDGPEAGLLRFFGIEQDLQNIDDASRKGPSKMTDRRTYYFKNPATQQFLRWATASEHDEYNALQAELGWDEYFAEIDGGRWGIDGPVLCLEWRGDIPPFHATPHPGEVALECTLGDIRESVDSRECPRVDWDYPSIPSSARALVARAGDAFVVSVEVGDGWRRFEARLLEEELPTSVTRDQAHH